MKKLSLLFAFAALLFGACKQNDDSNKPAASPFAGDYTGIFLVTSTATADSKTSQASVIDNPDGTSVQIQLTVDGATATLSATMNGAKLEIPTQTLFGNTVSGTADLISANQLRLAFVGTTGTGGGGLSQPYSAEFMGDR